jgi:hypothetical protein
LKEKFTSKIGPKFEVDGIDMKYSIIDDLNGGYRVKIYRGDSNEDREFPWERVKIEPSY